ncbi:MAG: hypothetical protein JST83_08270 [Bacteroidetes bacterium]|nr:hypothetical protein [Bacteroidota bacterium]
MKKIYVITLLVFLLSSLPRTAFANPTSGFCDSLSTFSANIVANNPYGISIDNFSYNLSYSFDFAYPTDAEYWHKKFDSCGLTYPSIVVDCGVLGNYMDSFTTQMPGYSLHCPPLIWTSYFNYYCYPAIKAYNSTYNWEMALGWCNVSYPSRDSLTTYCDSIKAIDSLYINFKANKGLSDLQNSFINTFGYYGYLDSQMVWHYADMGYWLNQMSSCGISCDRTVECSRVDSFMTVFKNQVPAYASSAPSFTWMRFLNYYNVSSNDYITAILNCCNIGYPSEDTLHNNCDSLAAAKTVVDSWPSYQASWQYTERMKWIYGNSGHFDGMQWVDNDLTYWCSQFSTCNVGCPNIINCHEIDSVMSEFYAMYPGTHDHCARFLWLATLNNYVGSRHQQWYSETDWISMLTCCNIHIPANDSIYSYCDSLGAALNLYNLRYPSGSTWYEFTGMLNLAGWQHFDASSGTMVNNDNQYYMTALQGCGYSMPSHLVDCGKVASVMQHFYQNHPEDTVHVFPYAWVYELNQAGAGTDGTGHYSSYHPGIWEPILQGCHVTYPAADSFSNRCDSIAYVLSTIKSHGDNLSGMQWRLDDLFDYNHWDSTTNSSISNTPLYWYQQIGACSLCSNIVSCDTLSRRIDSFKVHYPQYSIVCPGSVIGAYLSRDGSGGDPVFWHYMATCCNLDMPRDTDMTTVCDSAFALSFQVAAASNMVGGKCFPIWLLGAIASGNDFNWSLETFLHNDSLCGANIVKVCNDTMVTHCDSMRSIAYVYDIFFQHSHGQGDDMNPAPEDVFAALYGEYPTAPVAAMVMSCDSTNCIAINSAKSQTDILFPTYSCLPQKVFTAVMYGITGVKCTYDQWNTLYQHCGAPISLVCDSIYSPCDSLTEAKGLVQRIMTVFHVDSVEAYQIGFSAYYGRDMDNDAITASINQCTSRGTFCIDWHLACSSQLYIDSVNYNLDTNKNLICINESDLTSSTIELYFDSASRPYSSIFMQLANHVVSRIYVFLDSSHTADLDTNYYHLSNGLLTLFCGDNGHTPSDSTKICIVLQNGGQLNPFDPAYSRLSFTGISSTDVANLTVIDAAGNTVYTVSTPSVLEWDGTSSGAVRQGTYKYTLVVNGTNYSGNFLIDGK